MERNSSIIQDLRLPDNAVFLGGGPHVYLGRVQPVVRTANPPLREWRDVTRPQLHGVGTAFEDIWTAPVYQRRTNIPYASTLALENTLDGGYKLRVFHYQHEGQKNAIGVPERKGLKELVERFPKTQEGAREFLRAYLVEFGLPGGKRWWRVVDLPREETVRIPVTYRCAVRKACLWFGAQHVLVGAGSPGNRGEWELQCAVSPLKTDLTPICIPAEFHQDWRNRRILNIRQAGHQTEVARWTFLNDNHEPVLMMAENPGLRVDEVLAVWYDRYCAGKCFKWEVLERDAFHTRGTHIHDAFGNGWGEGRLEDIVPPRPADAEGRSFKEQIAMAAFHPKIVEKRLLEYGDDWFDRV